MEQGCLEIITTKAMENLVEKKLNNTGEKIFEYAQSVAESILQGFYGKKKMTFPITVREMARHYDIRLCETNLNADTGFQIGRLRGYLENQGEDVWTIYLDNSDGESEKRYVIAHELSHYFLGLSGDYYGVGGRMETQHCIDPLFSKSRRELIADIITGFLVLPPELVLEYLREYVYMLEERNIYPIDGFEWMRMLGQKAQIPFYFTLSSYQYLKFYLCKWYYDKADIEIQKRYGEFFK